MERAGISLGQPGLNLDSRLLGGFLASWPRPDSLGLPLAPVVNEQPIRTLSLLHLDSHGYFPPFFRPR